LGVFAAVIRRLEWDFVAMFRLIVSRLEVRTSDLYRRLAGSWLGWQLAVGSWQSVVSQLAPNRQTFSKHQHNGHQSRHDAKPSIALHVPPDIKPCNTKPSVQTVGVGY
jgi:hypothetical protein